MFQQPQQLQIKLLIGISASINVINMPMYLQFIKMIFPQIKVIVTKSAEYFLSKESIALVVDDVYGQMFPLPAKRDMCHVPLARWADLFVVMPATAHVIAQVANGLADTLLSASILAHDKPVMFFPNMNDGMWKNPATKRNVSLLKEYGHIVIPPIEREGFEYASNGKKNGGYMPHPQEVLPILKVEADRRTAASKQDEKATCNK